MKTSVLFVLLFAVGIAVGVGVRRVTADGRVAEETPVVQTAAVESAAPEGTSDDADEIAALREEVAALERQWRELPPAPLAEHIYAGPAFWYGMARGLRKLRETDPDNYEEAHQKAVDRWNKSAKYKAEEMEKLDALNDGNLTPDEAKALAEYRTCRGRIGKLEQFLSRLNEEATDEQLHAAFDEKWDLYLKCEKLSGKFRQISVKQGLRKMGVSEEKVAEATERTLDIFDLTRTPGRSRCPAR